MRTECRTALQASLPLSIPIICMGFSFGASAPLAGVATSQTLAMSLLVFAGSSQFAAVMAVGAGASPFMAALAGLLINARFLPFGLALAPALSGRRLRTAGLAYLLIDQNAALALSQPKEVQRDVYLWSGLMLFAAWNAGTLAGVLLGSVVDPQVLGLDAAVPAMIFALVAPKLRLRRGALAGAIGGIAFFATASFLPPGLPIVLAAVLAGACGYRAGALE